MYGICPYIYHPDQPNLVKYTIPRSYYDMYIYIHKSYHTASHRRRPFATQSFSSLFSLKSSPVDGDRRSWYHLSQKRLG